MHLQTSDQPLCMLFFYYLLLLLHTTAPCWVVEKGVRGSCTAVLVPFRKKNRRILIPTSHRYSCCQYPVEINARMKYTEAVHIFTHIPAVLAYRDRCVQGVCPKRRLCSGHMSLYTYMGMCANILYVSRRCVFQLAIDYCW